MFSIKVVTIIITQQNGFASDLHKNSSLLDENINSRHVAKNIIHHDEKESTNSVRNTQHKTC